MQRITVGDDLREIFDQLDKLEEETRSSVNLYTENKITLHMLASLLGKTIYDIWRGLLQDSSLKIRCAKGDYEERLIEDATLRDADKICVDLIGLFTMAELGILGILSFLFQEIYVYQSAMDELEEIIYRESTKREHMMLGKEGEQYVRQEVTEDYLKKNREFLEGIISYIRTSCILLPLEKPYSQKENRLAEIIGKSATDLITQRGDNIPIYTDDRNLRELAFNENRVGGIGIQTLLRKALEQGIISNDTYQENIISLIRLGYTYISIDAATLIYAVKANRGCANYDFETLLGVITNQYTEESSAIIVSADFIKALWQEKLPTQYKSSYLDRILAALIRAHNTSRPINQLKARLQIIMKLSPLQLREIVSTIEAWKKLSLGDS